MKRLLVAFAAIFAYLTVSASREQLIFTRISQYEGLTSTVNCIYKEPEGDLWFGCPSALYQFNGHLLRNRDDSHIKGKKILCIDTDHKGNMWVLTDKGLLRYNEVSDLFSPIGMEEDGEQIPFSSIFPDESGVWFGSCGKLYRFEYSDEAFFHFCNIEGWEEFNITQICSFDEHKLLCSSRDGLMFIDKESGAASVTPFGSRKEISAMLIDSKDRLWVAPYNQGIEVYSKDGNLIRTYSSTNGNLSNDIVLCMAERNSAIWVGTDGGGINIISTEDNTSDCLSYVSGDPMSFPANCIKSIYTDLDGNVWAGSLRKGVIRISQSGIKTYTDCHAGQHTGLSNPTVVCIHQDENNGKVWLGTEGEGLNLFDSNTGRFTHFRNTLKTKIVSIASYSENTLVLSSFGDKLLLLDKRNGSLTPLEIKDEEVRHQIKYSGKSVNLANEADGSLLMMTNSIWRHNRQTGKCAKITRPEGDRTNANLFPIGPDGNGLWLHDKYSIYYLKKGSLNLENKGGIDGTGLNSGTLDRKGNIWLATTTGLSRFNIAEGIFKDIETSLFDEAISVTCDNSSRVWIGTEDKMFAYFIDTDSFALFGESDGVILNEFINKSHLLAANGDVYMGGVNGLVHIDADFSSIAPEIPVIKLYDILIDNMKVRTDENGSFEVPRSSNSMRIEVSAQEKELFRKKVYRFMLSNGLVYETDVPVLEMKQLPPPGRYEVQVSCTKRSGNWTKPVKVAELRIPKPWYMSWWFILSTVLVLIAGIVLTLTVRAQKRRNMTRMLLKEQEQRLYEEKVALLINMSHELRTPLTLIMAPLKRLLSCMKAEEDNYETLSRIYRQSRRMRDLLNMVLDLRKMEEGKQDIRMEKADFNSWIREATDDIAGEEHAQGIEIILDLSSEVGLVDFDRRKCDTILNNILINAVKHSKPGDIITLRTELAGDMVRTSISDQGPGLSLADTSRIFTRFYQNANEKYGSGIGLSYSKILVEMQGGRIEAANNEGKGATFWWEIPVTARIEEEKPAKAYLNELMGYDPGEDFGVPESDAFKTSDKTLMLVDDSLDLLAFLKEALSQEFAEIITVQSGNKAYSELVSGKMPDIIVSDVNMPDGNGYSLCRQLKDSEKYSHIPVILLTARGEQQSQSDSYRVGADAFMAKPFEVETLVEMIRGILKRKEEIRKKYLDTESKVDTSYGSSEEGFIIRLNKVISDNLDNPDLDQNLLCNELGMSRAALFNKMKAISGTGAKEYITRIRIEKAKNLIETSSLTIAEISEKTGFASQSYFSTAFKSHTGMTPSQYRQKR